MSYYAYTIRIHGLVANKMGKGHIGWWAGRRRKGHLGSLPIRGKKVIQVACTLSECDKAQSTFPDKCTLHFGQ